MRSDFDDPEFGDDQVHTSNARKWERAISYNFGFAVFRGVFHGDDYALGPGDEIHSAPHALQHFSRNRPVGEIAFFVHLQRAKNCYITSPTAYHAERFRAGEITATGNFANCFFASID